MNAVNALSAYRAAAVRLREAAEWNRFDGDFQEGRDSGTDSTKWRPGRLIPLVDASVVKFFMDPDHEIHLIDTFASLQKPNGPQRLGIGDVEDVPRHMLTFARITAEFMFLSSPVRVGNEVGRLWEEAPLIAPAHAEETAAMLRRIEAKVASLYQRVAGKTEAEILHADDRAAAASVHALSEAGTRGSPESSDPESYRRLVRDVSGSVEELFLPGKANGQVHAEVAQEIRALEEAVRWLRLMKNSKLRPLLSHPLCDAHVLHPSDEEIRSVAEPLATYKRRSALARGESSARVMQRAWRDATVLIQTEMLNASARQTGEVGENTRFVLITADDALHTVYAERFWRPLPGAPTPEPANYVLRRPLQYIPVMNAKDIPNGYRAKELFDTFMLVLDSVTEFVVPRTCRAFALELDWRQRTQAGWHGRAALDLTALKRLADLWLEVTTATNALCAGLAVYDFGAEDLVRRLHELAGDERALASLINFNEQIFRDIDNTQLPLIAQEVLADAIGALRRYKKASGVAGVRMPILIRERFEDVTGNLPIERFITTLANSRVPAALSIAQLQAAMSDRWDRWKVLFFAGVVAAVANNFERAAQDFAQAVQLLRAEQKSAASWRKGSDRDLAEVTYLQCVVDRLRMRDETMFSSVRHRLNNLVEEAATDSFEYARAMSETGSLYLMRYFNIQFHIEPTARPGEATKMMSEAKRCLDKARRTSSTVRERRVVDLDLVNRLDSQIHANTICWYVVKSGFFDDDLGELDNSVNASLGILENVGSEQVRQSHIIGLWDRIAAWLVAAPGSRRDEAVAVAEFCSTRLRALSNLGVEFQAPADAAVFAFVARRAAAEAGLEFTAS